MKKFDSLISNYLYTNKVADIEGLGTFSLDDNFVLPPDTEKAAFYPLEGINFTYNTRVETTPELLSYIVQQTGKIKSLVSADFSSYVAEIKQFVNIGKPWSIEGIGTLQKTKDGRFELIPGAISTERVNVHYIENEDEKSQPVQRKRWIVGLLFTIAIVAVVAGLGFGIYVLFIKTQDKSSDQRTAGNIADTTSNVVVIDSVSKKPDSVVVKPDSVNISSSGDTSTYKVIHETTKWKERVEKRTAQLAQYGIKNHYDSFMLRDTFRYRMFIFQKIWPADTTKVRDSLSTYFGRKVRLIKIK